MNFLHEESKSEKKIKGEGRVGWERGSGVRGGVDEWTDEEARTNLPLQLLRSWGITMN